MAKKSAKSKGYRKVAQKKPYLTKKDIVILCVLLVIVAIGAVLLFTYDDGALKVKDGRIVDPGENWLIVNGSTNGGHRYYRVGEVGEIAGYTKEAQPFINDENLTQYNFTPEDEASAISAISITASTYDPARLAEGNARLVASVQGSEVTDVATDKAGNVEYTYYSYNHAYYAEDTDDAEDAAEVTEAAEDAGEASETAEEAAADDSAEAAEAPAEEAEQQTPNHFEQAINGYVSAPHNGSIVFTVSANVEAADQYLTEDQLKEALGQAIAAVTLAPEK